MKGLWKDANMHGAGEVRWPDGSFYRGDHVNGIRQGKGIYFNAKDGSKYEGDFANNAFHGIGALTKLGEGTIF